MRRLHPALVFGLALPLAGCIQDRLTVELFTQLHADGSCTRRVSYRVERIDTEKGDARVAIPKEKDPLRQFRIPGGEPWRVTEDEQLGLHLITAEALLPSPAAFEGDFQRSRGKRALPAHNAVSAFCDSEHGRYELQEVLSDPASPLAGARLLSRLALKADDDFAARLLAALPEAQAGPREPDLRRLFRDRLAAPFAREITAVAERPFYGPRERNDLARIMDAVDAKQKDLAARVAALSPDIPPDELSSAAERALGGLAERLLGEVDAAGLPLVSLEGGDEIRFHATLVMPAPILRANTCVAGDTAEWEFEEGDLFGRGFEMKALAAAR
jgi:hypothetical protein